MDSISDIYANELKASNQEKKALLATIIVMFQGLAIMSPPNEKPHEIHPARTTNMVVGLAMLRQHPKLTAETCHEMGMPNILEREDIASVIKHSKGKIEGTQINLGYDIKNKPWDVLNYTMFLYDSTVARLQKRSKNHKKKKKRK